MPLRASVALCALSLAVLGGCGGCGNSNRSSGSGTERNRSSGSASARQPAPAHAARGVRLKKVASFDSPIFVTAPPGDLHRLFVVERAGRIRIVKDGHKLARPFLDIHTQVRTDSERGLLSVAFAPDYARSGRFYVYFTNQVGDIHIQEFRRVSQNRASSEAARNLLTINHREFGNHDGGQLQFGPDGYLYAGTGDGGGAGDPHNHGQSLGTRLAKLLRIDPRHGKRYSVKGNPFVGRRGAKKEIWAYGLRNPWRFSFDRSTGDLVIADVGQDTLEEIDFARRGTGRGANYGWNVFEGTRHYRNGSAPGAVRPRVTHPHSAGYCSITGGYVVRDRSLGSLYGRYVYGDLCHPELRSVKLGRSGGASSDRGMGISVQNLVSFGEDGRGRVYAVSLGGPVLRLAPK